MFTVSINVEADSARDAAGIVSTWALNPGAVVVSIVGQPETYAPGLPATVAEDGTVRAAIEEQGGELPSEP